MEILVANWKLYNYFIVTESLENWGFCQTGAGSARVQPGFGPGFRGRKVVIFSVREIDSSRKCVNISSINDYMICTQYEDK